MQKRKGPISKLYEQFLYNSIMGKKKKLSKLQKNKNCPYSKYWRTKADTLWSSLVRSGKGCEYCGSKDSKTNAHHLLPKEIYHQFRYDVKNGISLCAYKCHKLVAHKNPVMFLKWLQLNKKTQYDWIMDRADKLNSDKINFKEEYERLL